MNEADEPMPDATLDISVPEATNDVPVPEASAGAAEAAPEAENTADISMPEATPDASAPEASPEAVSVPEVIPENTADVSMPEATLDISIPETPADAPAPEASGDVSVADASPAEPVLPATSNSASNLLGNSAVVGMTSSSRFPTTGEFLVCSGSIGCGGRSAPEYDRERAQDASAETRRHAWHSRPRAEPPQTSR